MDKMNIEQWFEHMRNQELSDSEKVHIYNRINEQINKTLFMSKVRWYMKAGSFVAAIAVAAFLFFASYSPSSPEELMVVDTTNPAVTTLKPDPNQMLVTADTVGELIAVDGDIAIYKGDDEIETQNLDSGDIVLLKENARVELTVRQGVKATITGPAKFTIEHVTVNPSHDIYMLNLLEGEYVEVKAIQIFDEEDLLDKPETVVVKTPTLEIQQLPATKNLSVTISTQNGIPTVENDGDDVIVKSLNEDSDGDITVLASNETFVVSHQETLTDEAVEQLTQDLEEDTFTIRYEVEEDSTTLLQGENLDSELVVLEDVDTSESEEKTLVSKRVLDQSIFEQLEKSLSVQYTHKHIQDIATYSDNPSAQSIAIANLAVSINKARGSVGLGASAATLDGLKNGVSGLHAYLQDTYFVSPGLAERLYAIQGSLDVLKEAVVE